MKRTDQHPSPHDPKSCALCGSLRHPGTAVQGRALAAHLAKNPLPRQTGSQQ